MAVLNNEIINSLTKVLKYLPQLFDDEVAIGITDKDTFISEHLNPKLPLNLKVGSKVQPGGAVFEAIKTGNTVIKDVPKELYGFPVRSYAVPIKNDHGDVEGCLVLGKSLAKKTDLTMITQNLSSSLGQISVAINNFSVGVQEVADMNSDIASKVKDADEDSKDTDDILNFIQGIAAQTNMLGLNAAIEASRAGESGKGFKVVATEIRKLSTSTSESIKKIDSVLKNVGASIKSINGKINKSNEVFQDQAASLEEIAASIEKLNETAHLLETLAQKI